MGVAMTARLAPLALLAALACSERKVEPSAAVPSVEDVCDAVCVMYDACSGIES